MNRPLTGLVLLFLWVSFLSCSTPFESLNPFSSGIRLSYARLEPIAGSGPSGQVTAFQVQNRHFVLEENGDFWEFLPGTHTFVARARPPFTQGMPRSPYFPVFQRFTMTIGNRAYVGGQSEIAVPGTSGTFYKFFFEYEPASDHWVIRRTFPDASGVPVADQVLAYAAEGTGYVGFFGHALTPNGWVENSLGAAFLEYDPATDHWKPNSYTLVTLPEDARVGPRSVALGKTGSGRSAHLLVNIAPKTGALSAPYRDAAVVLYEFNPQSFIIARKLMAYPFRKSKRANPPLLGGVAANGKLWYVTDGAFSDDKPVPSELFTYTPATNTFERLEKAVEVSTGRAIYQPTLLATEKAVLVGMGSYGYSNGTPGGAIRGFAQFGLSN